MDNGNFALTHGICIVHQEMGCQSTQRIACRNLKTQPVGQAQCQVFLHDVALAIRPERLCIDHPVAGFEMRHVLADFEDDTCALLARRKRLDVLVVAAQIGFVPSPRVNVSVVHTDGIIAYLYLIGAGMPHFHIFYFHDAWCAIFPYNDSSHILYCLDYQYQSCFSFRSSASMRVISSGVSSKSNTEMFSF